MKSFQRPAHYTQFLFKLAYESKLESFRAGRSTRLLDRILFKKKPCCSRQKTETF